MCPIFRRQADALHCPCRSFKWPGSAMLTCAIASSYAATRHCSSSRRFLLRAITARSSCTSMTPCNPRRPSKNCPRQRQRGPPKPARRSRHRPSPCKAQRSLVLVRSASALRRPPPRRHPLRTTTPSSMQRIRIRRYPLPRPPRPRLCHGTQAQICGPCLRRTWPPAHMRGPSHP